MADLRQTPISQLPPLATAPSLSSPVVIVQGGVTYRATVGDIIALAGGGGIEEAPENGIIHGRLNAAWEPIPVNYDAPFVVELFAGTSRTLDGGDNNKLIVCSSATAVTLTVAAGLPANWKCDVMQDGAGQVTIVGAGGVTLRASDGLVGASMEAAVIGIARIAPDRFVVYGDR